MSTFKVPNELIAKLLLGTVDRARFLDDRKDGVLHLRFDEIRLDIESGKVGFLRDGEYLACTQLCPRPLWGTTVRLIGANGTIAVEPFT